MSQTSLNILVTATTAQAQAQLAAVNTQMKTMAAQAGVSGGALGKIGKGAAGIGAVGAAAVIAGKQLYDLGKEFDEAYDKIRVGTGATGKELDKLKGNFKNVAKTVPNDFKEVGTAVADLNTRLGLSGKPLERMAENVLNLSNITGTDLQGNIKSVARSFVDWEVPVRKQTSALDGLFRLSQKSGASVTEIADNIQKFGSPLRTLGLDIDYAAAMFANFERAGVNMQTMVPGLKLAIGNMVKPSDELAKKFETLGVEADKPAAGLQKIFAAIGNKSKLSDVDKMSLAMDVFGKRAGADMAEAVRQGRFDVEDFMAVFNNTKGDSIRKAADETYDFSENAKRLGNNLKIYLEPVASDVFQKANDAVVALSKGVDLLDKGQDSSGFVKKLGEIWEVADRVGNFDFSGTKKALADVFGVDWLEPDKNSYQAIAERARTAMETLRKSSANLANAQRRQRGATQEQRAAEAALRDARLKHGNGSDAVAQAEIRLHRAKKRTIRLTKEAREAEKLHGVERDIAKSRLRETAVAEKARIGRLSRTIDVLKRQRNIEWKRNGDSPRLRELENKITEAQDKRRGSQRKLNNTLESASKQIGPKFARQLQNISARTATLAENLPQLNKRVGNLRGAWQNALPVISKVGTKSKTSFDKAELSMSDYAKATGQKRKTINNNMRAMPPVQRTATGTMMDLFRDAMSALDDGGTPRVSKRRGGAIQKMFKGFAAGGMVPAAVSPGEMIVFGQKVGVVPGRPTARDSVHMDLPVGAKVFTFDGQRRLAEGASDSEALRKQRPHFAAGGIVKPSVEGGSTKARALANKAIGKVHGRAVEKYRSRKERLAAMAAASGNFNYTGPPADFSQLGNNSWVDSHTLAVGAYLSRRFGVNITDGWRPQNASYGAVNSSHKRGTPGNPGALDFAPPSSAMQAFIGKHVAGITENDIHDWGTGLHNHVAFFGKGGFVRALTVKGAKASRKQTKVARMILNAAARTGAGKTATLAALMAATQESNMGELSNPFQLTRDFGGVGPESGAYQQAIHFFKKGFWNYGGAIELAKKGHSPGDIAQLVEGSAYPTLYAQWESEARRTLGAWDGADITGADSGKTAAQKKAEKEARRARKRKQRRATAKAGRTLAYAKEVREEAKNGKLARRAVRAAKKAVGFAKDGELGKANRWTERAQNLSKRAARSIPGLGSRRPGLATNKFDPSQPFSVTNLPGFSALPKPIQDLMMSPGLSGAARLNLANLGLTMAGETATKTDDAAALNVILRIQKNQKARAQKNLRKANTMLAKGGLTKKQKRRWMGVRDRSLETISSTTGDIISTRGSIKDLNESESETSMAEAMKELAEAIKEQNRLQSGVQAVGSREALRMLSDVISGEIVGKRSAPVNSYSGVRY